MKKLVKNKKKLLAAVVIAVAAVGSVVKPEYAAVINQAANAILAATEEAAPSPDIQPVPTQIVP